MMTIGDPTVSLFGMWECGFFGFFFFFMSLSASSLLATWSLVDLSVSLLWLECEIYIFPFWFEKFGTVVSASGHFFTTLGNLGRCLKSLDHISAE
jgi:hypothetical protein